MRWKRLTNQILTGNFKLGGLTMGNEVADNIINTLDLNDINGILHVRARNQGADILEYIQHLVRFGLKMEQTVSDFLSFPPHTPPFKNNIINNKNNTEGVINKISLSDLTKSNPIVSGKSPLEKKAEKKKNRKPKNKTAMPAMWVNDRAHETLKDHVLVEYCEKHGYDWYGAKELFLHFVDHHLAKGSKFVKWYNAFYMWVRNDAKFNGPPAKKVSGVIQSFEIKNTLDDLFKDDANDR
jgi:hypothetical protein